MTIHKSHEYKKLDAYSRNTIDLSIKKLEERYDNYRKQNIVITNLFGDDNLIHDIINGEFYIFKCRNRNVQVRLLYNVDDKNNLNVISFFIKNNDNKLKSFKGSNEKRYIKLFEKIANEYKRSVTLNENRNSKSTILCKQK